MTAGGTGQLGYYPPSPDAVIAWLDAGQPDPDHAVTRIRHLVDAVVQAAHPD